jgi:hypothetical protein
MLRIQDIEVLRAIADVREELRVEHEGEKRWIVITKILERLLNLYACLDVVSLAEVLERTDKGVLAVINGGNNRDKKEAA